MADTQRFLDFDLRVGRPPVALLNPDDIYSIASESLLRDIDEGSIYERKPPGIHAENLSEWICMWANTPPMGGLIAVGIADNGDFVGCTNIGTDRLNALEKAGRTFCADARYELQKVPIQNGSDFVLLIRVLYRPDKVVETNSGNAFIRRGDSKYRLTEEEKRELAIDKGQVSFEQEPCGLRYPDDFDIDSIARFAAGVKTKKALRTDYTLEQILTNRCLGRFDGRDFVPNIACALLFARTPQAVVPGCMVRFQRFEGTERLSGENRNVVKDIVIEGTVPTLIVETDKVITSQIREFWHWLASRWD
jgi:ATP-dependent DNA helicase RecG